jgi:hypothetical protein
MDRDLFCFALSVIVLGSGPADTVPQSSVDDQDRRPRPSPARVERPPVERVVLDMPVDVPMRVFRGLPLVEVRLNGNGPFTFAIDTGSMLPVTVGPELAERLGAVAPEEGARFRVETIDVGTAVFEGVPAEVRRPLESHPPVHGILGLPLFAEVLLTVDYPGDRIRITREQLSDLPGTDILPLERHPTGLAFLELSANGHTLPALLDTGNLAAPFYLPRSFATRLKWAGELSASRTARTSGGEIALEEVRLATEIRVGPFVFERPVVVFGDIVSRAIIGGQALSDYAVSIDQRTRRVRVTRRRDR